MDALSLLKHDVSPLDIPENPTEEDLQRLLERLPQFNEAREQLQTIVDEFADNLGKAVEPYREQMLRLAEASDNTNYRAANVAHQLGLVGQTIEHNGSFWIVEPYENRLTPANISIIGVKKAA